MITDEFSFWAEVKKDIVGEIRKMVVRLVLWLIDRFSINPEELWPAKRLRHFTIPRRNGLELVRTVELRGQPCSLWIRINPGGVLNLKLTAEDLIDRSFLLRELMRVIGDEGGLAIETTQDRVAVLPAPNPNGGVDLFDLAGHIYFRLDQLARVTETFMTLPSRLREYYQIPAEAV